MDVCLKRPVFFLFLVPVMCGGGCQSSGGDDPRPGSEADDPDGTLWSFEDPCGENDAPYPAEPVEPQVDVAFVDHGGIRIDF